MSYKVDVLDKSTLIKLKEIEVVNEPVINEEINGSFTFSFDAHYSAKNDLTSNVLISVDGKYFKIAKVTKSRDDSITLSVYCEHISYELIIDYDLSEDMEFESDAQSMISQFLQGTRFNLVYCMPSTVMYYRTKSLDIRKRLFEVANLFGGELIFDNFNISLVQQRGSDKGLDVELGTNLLGVTEEQNFVDGKTSYELDLVDLSQINGYELDFSSAEIGDTITIRDNVLGINTNERIIVIQYNPFKKTLPTVTVGDYIPDLTDYFKDEEEEEEEDPRTNYLLDSLKVGTIECLDLSSIEIDNDEVLPDGISASIDFSEYEKLKGVSVKLKSQYSGYHITVYKVLKEDDFETFNYATNVTDINNWLLPTEDIVGIGVLVTAVPFAEFDADVHKFAQYGIKFNRAALDAFREVRVGKINVLKLDGVEMFPPFNLPNDIVAEVPFEEGTTLTGLFVSMKQDYKNWYVKLTTYNEAGTATEYNLADIEATAKTWTMPSSAIAAISLTVMEKPPAEFVDGTHKKQTIAFKFYGTTIDKKYLETLRVGEIDVIDLVSNDTESVKSLIKGNVTQVIANAKYTTDEQHTGLFAKLLADYSAYNLTILDYTKDENNVEGFQVVPYSAALENWLYPSTMIGTRSFVIVISELAYNSLNANNIDTEFMLAFGISFEHGDPLKEEKLYLEFGTAPLADVMTLSFKNGPYDEIKSITTGLSGGGLSSDVSISVDEIGDDKITSLKAYATNASESATVNFQAVCMKLEVIKDGEG